MSVYLVVAVISYFIGSIPTGYLVGKLRGVDLRTEGSGNIGATNALRVLGKKLGYFVFLTDAFKGGLAVWVGFCFAGIFEGGPQLVISARVLAGFCFAGILGGGSQTVINAGCVAAFFVMFGQSYPVWLKFQGGKGMGTAAGYTLTLFPVPVFLSAVAAWLGLFFGTRYVSIASIAAALALPTATFAMMLAGRCDPARVWVAIAVCGLAIWRHKPNIERLLVGTEKRFERKK